MPLTVITVKTVPPSLRGDLTKWMQEIATGVYVGNFNSKVREELWERVKQSAGTGEATMSFSYRNEIGYQFATYQTQCKVIDYDGIPLVQMIYNKEHDETTTPKKGFSNASKYHQARKYVGKGRDEDEKKIHYCVIDIETDGLNVYEHGIIEIGALCLDGQEVSKFQTFIKHDRSLPPEIISLTGITNAILEKEGIPIIQAIEAFLSFIGDSIIVGYNVEFDYKFLNQALKKLGLDPLKNKVYDLKRFVKKEKKFLNNYKLDTVLQAYEIKEKVPHLALEDAKLILDLSYKVNAFQSMINRG